MLFWVSSKSIILAICSEIPMVETINHTMIRNSKKSRTPLPYHTPANLATAFLDFFVLSRLVKLRQIPYFRQIFYPPCNLFRLMLPFLSRGLLFSRHSYSDPPGRGRQAALKGPEPRTCRDSSRYGRGNGCPPSLARRIRRDLRIHRAPGAQALARGEARGPFSAPGQGYGAGGRPGALQNASSARARERGVT